MGRTPIDYAAWQNYKEIIDLLLIFKADVNTVDVRGNTALRFSV